MYNEFEPLMKITIGSHYFKINNMKPRVVGLVYKFVTRYVQMEFQKADNGRSQLIPGKVYAAKTRDNSEFRFHIGQFQDFLKMLDFNFITPDLYECKIRPLTGGKPIKASIKKHWVLKDYQVEVVEFIVQEDSTDFHSRMVTMPTGTGKTVSAMAAVNAIKRRTIISVLPKYIEKWAGDVVNIMDVTPKDVMCIQGSSQLKSLIEMAKNKTLVTPFIIISVSTIQNFFKAYELDKNSEDMEDYGCHPEDLYEVLEAGTMIIDETHEHIHSIFKILMYSHIAKIIALSGTLISDDPFIQRIHTLIFPKEIRFDKVKMEKYIKVYPISYQFHDMNRSRIKTTENRSNVYSHNAFEKSLIRHPQTLNNYLKLIDYIVSIGYIQDYIKGDKLAIYASSIDMCTKITNYIKDKYPQYDVRRYVEKDPYVNCIEPDIRVTTILSAGTAVDIPNLRTVIMTNSILSSTSNLQLLGRLRKLPDRDAKFYYLFSENIPKQCQFHNARKELFKDRIQSLKEFRAPFAV